MSALLAKLPPRDLADLVLPDGVEDTLLALLEEYQFRAALRAHKLEPRSRLLLHGPPGCGKTSLAAALGGALGRSTLSLRLSAARGTYVAETGKNLEAAFIAARTSGDVLLLDEVDAIAGERSRTTDGSSAGREENAQVCTLLNLLDEAGDLVLVGATNRPDIIDAAVRRRFDVEIELPQPTPEAAAALAAELFSRHAWPMPAGWKPPLASFDAVEKAAITTIRAGVIAAARGAS